MGYLPAFLLSTGALPPFFCTRAFTPFINFLVCGDNEVVNND